jgi:hypothetical protein
MIEQVGEVHRGPVRPVRGASRPPPERLRQQQRRDVEEAAVGQVLTARRRGERGERIRVEERREGSGEGDRFGAWIVKVRHVWSHNLLVCGAALLLAGQASLSCLPPVDVEAVGLPGDEEGGVNGTSTGTVDCERGAGQREDRRNEAEAGCWAHCRGPREVGHEHTAAARTCVKAVLQAKALKAHEHGAADNSPHAASLNHEA